jgi:hypothetical protein
MLVKNLKMCMTFKEKKLLKTPAYFLSHDIHIYSDFDRCVDEKSRTSPVCFEIKI